MKNLGKNARIYCVHFAFVICYKKEKDTETGRDGFVSQKKSGIVQNGLKKKKAESRVELWQ